MVSTPHINLPLTAAERLRRMASSLISTGQAKVVLPSAQSMYEAAARWRDEALINDRSLYSGQPLDGRAAGRELVRCQRRVKIDPLLPLGV
jgi:hypothetical protein